jgi:hypothetical protein
MMAKSNFTPMSVLDFGRALLEAKDLDPLYTMLHESGIPLSVKKRFLLAYSCYYHVGVASYISEKRSTFHQRMREADDKHFPRSAERRHFRGGTADYVITFMKDTYPRPEDAVDFIIGPEDDRSFKAVTSRVRTWKYFGPWIAFKWADLIDRVLDIPIDFSECHLDIYDAPKQGAKLVAESLGRPDASVAKVVSFLNRKFEGHLAPPFYDRPINVQESETVLCKWKSHTNQHYVVGNDIYEIKAGLENSKGLITGERGWGELGDHLLKFMPTVPDGFVPKHEKKVKK